MKIYPLHDYVVVKRAEQEETTAGGIIVSAAVAEKPITGIVVAVGPGRTDNNGNLCKLEVAVQDTVLFGKYAGVSVTLEGEDYLFIRESEIFAVL